MRLMLPEMIKTKDGRLKCKVSKHKMKAQVRERLNAQGILATPHLIAQQMPVFANTTQQGYLKVWQNFFAFVRESENLRDPSRIKKRHIEQFLQSKIDSGMQYRSFKTYTTAISKLEVALNKVKKYPIQYSKAVDRLRKVAKDTLECRTLSRSYTHPDVIVQKLGGIYQIAAELQLHCGCRISEISELKMDRNMLGYNSSGDGRIRLTNTKGGKIRTVSAPKLLYEKLEKVTRQHGKFQFNRRFYAREFKKAVDNTSGETWSGSHGLRWNYAQNRFYELQRHENATYDEALQTVSQELGHTRLGITLHYLQ